uniref:PIN domain-containing protein n=1 Tax=Ignisphaera aggregans TaxID=334771 RepID=A0A7C4D128_9CREN
MPYGEYYYLKKAIEDSRARVVSSLRKLIKAKVIVLENEELYIDKAVEISIDHHVAVYDTLYIAQAFCRGGAIN